MVAKTPGPDITPAKVAQAEFDAEIELSVAEREAIRVEATKRAREAIKQEMMKAEKQLAYDEALRREKQRLGLIPEDQPEDEVDVTIDVAPFAAISPSQTGLRINERVFYNGFSYTVSKALARTLMDMCACTWRHQQEIEGRDTFYYRSRGLKVGDGKGNPVVAGNTSGLRI